MTKSKRTKTVKTPEVTVILTGYNEGKGLLRNLRKVKRILDSTRLKWEIILWDDKSGDDTARIFSVFAGRKKNIRFFQNEKNLGRGATVKNALKKARGRIVGYIDTDLELSPIYLPEFVFSLKDGSDMAIAKRIYAVGASNFLRAVLSRAYVFLVNRLLGINLSDTEAGFKFFKKAKIMPVVKKIKDNRWFFDTEIVVRSVWRGLKVTEIPVVYVYDPQKASSVNILTDTIIYFKKLLEFRKERPH